MKTLTIILTFIVLFSGCADNNAFSKFNMNEKQELSANALQRSKVKSEEKVNGIVSTVYLNIVSPQEYNEDEYFYVYVYVKNRDHKFRFLLNKIEASSIEELQSSNMFTELTSVDDNWNKYYLVRFPKQGDKLNFVFENGPYSSDILKFEKDE